MKKLFLSPIFEFDFTGLKNLPTFALPKIDLELSFIPLAFSFRRWIKDEANK